MLFYNYCQTYPLRLFNAASFQLFYIMGIPVVVTTDQGREFHNQVNKELMNVFRIQHPLTTAYHPQANGLDERLNQTLVNTLAKFAQEKRELWDVQLPEVVYAYNTAVQKSTKHTPFQAMFGRMVRLPVDFNATIDPDVNLQEFMDADTMDSFQCVTEPTKHTPFQAMFGRMVRLPVDFNATIDPDVNLQEFMDADTMDSFQCATERQRTLEAVKENIEQAQKKQKEHYDLKHSAETCFNVGSVVLKKDFTRKRRRGGKLDYWWEGPYVISKSLGKGLFQLKELDGDKVSHALHINIDSWACYWVYCCGWHSVKFILGLN